MLKDTANYRRLLCPSGVIESEQQNPGMMQPPTIHQLPEVLVHRDEKAALPKSQSENLAVGQRRINVAYGENIVSGFPQESLHRYANPNVDDELQRKDPYLEDIGNTCSSATRSAA